MSNTRINTTKINELPETTVLSDNDITIQDNGLITRKLKLSTLVQYIKNHSEIFDFYVHKSSINNSSGICPLNKDKKIPSDNIIYGKTAGTVYSGSEGASLETTVNYHVLDKNNPHEMTLLHLGIPKVENKSSQDIRNDLTYEDITTALGFVPGEGGGESYSIATDSIPGLIKSGTDIIVDPTGNVSVKNDSHNHTDKMNAITGTYSTFSAFWTAINDALKQNTSYSVCFKVKDTGNWSGFNTWVQGIAYAQNLVNSSYDIGGTIILSVSGQFLRRGIVSGTTVPTVIWHNVLNTETCSEIRTSKTEPSNQVINDYWIQEY